MPRGVLGAVSPWAVLFQFASSTQLIEMDLFRSSEMAAFDRFDLENVNLGDIGGVIKYVHTETIVESQMADMNAPYDGGGLRNNRKYHIDVWGRFRFKFKNPAAWTYEISTAVDFGPFVTFDFGESTGPAYREDGTTPFSRFGEWIGTQV